MSNLDVFKMEHRYDVENAVDVLKAKIDPRWIKQRQQGSTTLSYIGGHTVINLLNKAFAYQWSFEIIEEEIIESLPKPMYEGWGKNRKAVLNADGTQKMEPQPPVVKVKGRLTVPGLGFREQYGSKILIGGATEQESAFKSASTDALKKCASLFGIGIDLYGEDEGFDEEQIQTPEEPVQQVVQEPVAQAVAEKPVTQPAPQPAQPVQQASTYIPDPNEWDPVDINKLKELKQILGITDNAQLDPYVREFLDNKDMTYLNITPQNIKAFNVYLGNKAKNM